MPLDAARDAVIAMQARVIEVLAGQVRDLAARVERLERLASRNSGNSSMPPSADDLPGRTQPRRKQAGGGKRKPGKQPGAPGSHLPWSSYPTVCRTRPSRAVKPRRSRQRCQGGDRAQVGRAGPPDLEARVRLCGRGRAAGAAGGARGQDCPGGDSAAQQAYRSGDVAAGPGDDGGGPGDVGQVITPG